MITGKGSAEEQRAAWRALLTHFEWALRLLHPFMPFLTEELWRATFDSERSLSLQEFPLGDSDRIDDNIEQEMVILQNAIIGFRNLRAEHKINPKQKVRGKLAVHTVLTRDEATALQEAGIRPFDSRTKDELLHLVTKNHNAIERLANLSLEICTEALRPEEGLIRSSPWFDVQILLTDADLKAEVVRLRKQKQKLEKELGGMRARLADRHFMEKAPDEVVRGLEQRQAQFNTQYEKITSQLSRLEQRLSSGGDHRKEAQP